MGLHSLIFSLLPSQPIVTGKLLFGQTADPLFVEMSSFLLELDHLILTN
jgi:hypothetical protein